MGIDCRCKYLGDQRIDSSACPLHRIGRPRWDNEILGYGWARLPGGEPFYPDDDKPWFLIQHQGNDGNYRKLVWCQSELWRHVDEHGIVDTIQHIWRPVEVSDLPEVTLKRPDENE